MSVALRRAATLGFSATLSALACFLFIRFIAYDGNDLLDFPRTLMIAVSTFWLAYGVSSACIGVLARTPAPPPHVLRPASADGRRVAIVVPVYNEDPPSTFSRIAAMDSSLERIGAGPEFHFAVLSDTTSSEVAQQEAAWFERLVGDRAAEGRMFYRRRPVNTGKKAGNIEDFISRSGGAYDYVLILDADSLMEGETILEMVRRMDADPKLGLLQTLPTIIHAQSFFGRAMQFSASYYSPIYARGLAWLQGREGPFWGHNAMVRTAAFAASCGLPVLSGKPPFGGHILSHDFVEAALLRRAGWDVYMLADLQGSYEESPPSLIDLSARDRRWCQGNLQHMRVIMAKGLKLPTRQHFATGIMSYLASPFWLFQLIVGIALVLQTTYIRPEYFARDFRLYPIWPRFDPERALALFALTMGILLAPKIFGLILMLLRRADRRASGGGIRLVLSSLIEMFLSALLAPILMLIQSGSVFQILLGRDTGWQPQRRDDGSIPFKDIVRRHRAHTVLGVLAGISAFMIATSLFLWMSPTILGLLLAIPLSWLSGQLGAGLALKRLGLLLTPEESQPPAIATRANELQIRNAAFGFDDEDGLKALYADEILRERHCEMLPSAPPRKRGVIETERALAEAKLVDAETIDEASSWLHPKERMVVLHDRALLNMLVHLKPRPPEAQAAE